MKIAYGTYVMPLIKLESVIPMLARVGYDGVGICIGSNHLESMPDKINATRRQELKQLLSSLPKYTGVYGLRTYSGSR